jgi:hypothetical protein
MYEFKVIFKKDGRMGLAKWLGSTRQNSFGIYKPVFRVTFADGSYVEAIHDELEFIDKPPIL